jgi:uncharacterized membrane protein YfcA
MNAALAVAIGAVALLYAAVGHAGATGYIAVMTLFGIGPGVIRPTALVLNVLVASIASVQFFRAGQFRSGLFWPLAAASVPCALLGGMLLLPTGAFEKLVGAVLLVSAIRLLYDAWPKRNSKDVTPTSPPAPPLLAAIGAGIGLLSGLTGVGGGVFLTPLLLALRAAPVREVAAITAPFILVNSLAGIAGGLAAGGAVPPISLPVIAAAILGGTIGSQLGAYHLPVRGMQLLMAAVLTIASVKLFGP